MRLDPILFGELVILKPMDLDQTSKGTGVQMLRRRRLEEKRPGDFPPDHPIHQARDGYIVQKSIDTGRFPSFFRVQTFLHRVIYAWHSTLVEPRCPLDASDAEIERTTVATQGGSKSRKLTGESAIISLAERVHAGFPEIPMLAVDILRGVQRRAGTVFQRCDGLRHRHWGHARVGGAGGTAVAADHAPAIRPEAVRPSTQD